MLKYRGGKTKELSELIPYVPESYDRYVEPFLGGGALFFHLMPEHAVINDLNAQLMGFYRGVRDEFGRVRGELEELAELYAKNRQDFERRKAGHPDERVPDGNEELYYRLRDMYNGKVPSDYSEAALYFFINKTAYSGMIRHNADGDFNVPYGRYKTLNASQVTSEHSVLLRRSEVCVGDYQDVFNGCRPDDFVFLDPPYDCVFSDYGNASAKDGFTEDEHRRLAEAFANLPCKALMVIGKTDLTYGLYKGSIVHEYDKRYAVNIRNRFKAASTHILVANYRC